MTPNDHGREDGLEEEASARPRYLYVHVPFCRRACSYCDFYFVTSERHKSRFVAAVEREMAMRSGGAAATLYFGGGTPSRLAPEEMNRLVEAAKRNFDLLPGAEITLEANPEDVQEPAEWKAAGINRVSLGVQSLYDDELRFMHRAHSSQQALAALESVARVFDNYTFDLIYATPGLSDDAWERTLDTLLALRPPHFSAYALTIESRTRLAKEIERGKIRPPDDEKFVRQFERLMDAAEKHGYEHYETSNFARPGFRAVHNSGYWRGESYWGFGPSAHSYDGERRRHANVARLDDYLRAIENDGLPTAFEETLGDGERHNEYVLTRLRTAEGIPMDEYLRRFGKPPAVQGVQPGWLKVVDNHLQLTRAGKIFADAAAAALFV